MQLYRESVAAYGVNLHDLAWCYIVDIIVCLVVNLRITTAPILYSVLVNRLIE